MRTKLNKFILYRSLFQIITNLYRACKPKYHKLVFDKIIIEFVKTGKLYFGVSAGNILANPDISAVNTGLEPDKNDVNLTDLTGLNLTNVIVSPHYCEKEKPIIEKFRRKSQYEVIPLTDE